MNKIAVLQKYHTTIPAPVKTFLLRSSVIFIFWKLLYLLILLPARVPDKQLTNFTAKTTSLFYNTFHTSHADFYEENTDKTHKTTFFINGVKAIGIADRCNALELLILYAGFLFSIPLGWKRQWLYLVPGIISIFILNILRCYALAILNLNHSSVADFAHHYFFTMIIYGLIFFTWIQYSKPYFKNEQ